MSGECYSETHVAGRQEREQKHRSASLQALDRGMFGCQISAVEMVRIMGALVRMHQSEFEMQVRRVHLSLPRGASSRAVNIVDRNHAPWSRLIDILTASRDGP